MLEGFAIRNIKNFKEINVLSSDRCQLHVEMRSLIWRKPLVIRHIEATGVMLVIERNSQRELNIQTFINALKSIESAEAPSIQIPQQKPAIRPAPAKSTPRKPFPVHLRHLAVNGLLRYVDSKRDKTYDLSLRLTASNLFTIPAQDQPDSLLVLRGALLKNKNTFVTDLNAVIKPLTDPNNPTFNAIGSILDIDIDFLNDLLQKNDMESRSFSINPSIICTQGRLDGSLINLTLNDLAIHKTEIGDTALNLPLNGTLSKPSIDLTDALQTFFSDQAIKIGQTIIQRKLKKGLGIDTNATPSDLLINGLMDRVNELKGNTAAKKTLKNLGTRLFGN